MILKFGDSGSAVKKLQEILGIKITGRFDLATLNAVMAFQKANKLKVDGIVGPKTARLLKLDIEKFISTDLSNISINTIEDKKLINSGGSVIMINKNEKLIIDKLFLNPKQYINIKTEKYFIILHHTAGNHDPYQTIKLWNNDTRGRIATHYVIGGISLANNNKLDGIIVQAFPDRYWAYHLGLSKNSRLNAISIGIEICNWGYLIKGNDGKFRNYLGEIVPDNMVCDLGFKFKGYQYYHNYTDNQIKSLYNLILQIKQRYPRINLKKGLYEWLNKESPNQAFEYKTEFINDIINTGIFSHSNVRKDKIDIYPHPKLIEMIKSL